MSTTETPRRRRGAALEDAILDAAYDELTDVGYGAFSVENVAARARTGKASIYRRWPTKQALVLDSLGACLPGPKDPASIVREFCCEDMTTADALREVGKAIVRTMHSPSGRALRAVKLEAATDPELAELVDTQFQAPRRAGLIALLERGVARGEVRPEAATALIADVLPAVITHRMLLQQEPVDEHVIEAIIEQVMIPLVSA
ncbi:TetR/AcrR family transcriptional regulator [Jatrophihabitans fulvus]